MNNNIIDILEPKHYLRNMDLEQHRQDADHRARIEGNRNKDSFWSRNIVYISDVVTASIIPITVVTTAICYEHRELFIMHIN